MPKHEHEDKEPSPAETITIELDPPYAGWRAACDADPDWGFLDDLSGALQGGRLGLIGTALLRCVRSWNFRARDGSPAPLTPEGLRTVSARAIVALATAYAKWWYELPNPRGGA